jgi:hypothetical protein
MLVKTAARPTTECSAATICGSSVAVILLPISVPMPPPKAARPANCTNTSAGKPTAAREASIPDPTPSMPRTLPCRAVACEPKPEREAKQGWASARADQRGQTWIVLTDAKNAASQISRLDQTCNSSTSSGQETASEDNGGNPIEPSVLRWISFPCESSSFKHNETE